VAANHTSYLDPPLLAIALAREAVFMAKEELFRVPLLGRFIGRYAFPVRRDAAQPSTLKEAVRRLKEGHLVVLFPGGGRARMGDGTQEVKRGVGVLQRLSGAPVLPAYIEGANEALPVGARLLRPRKLRVCFGPLLRFPPGAQPQEVAQEVAQAIRRLRACR
jgi:1-acyl-sn-glycerol-3-phosphate acyltransferase